MTAVMRRPNSGSNSISEIEVWKDDESTTNNCRPAPSASESRCAMLLQICTFASPTLHCRRGR